MTDARAAVPAGAEPAGGTSKNRRRSPPGPAALSSYNGNPLFTGNRLANIPVEALVAIAADARRPLPDPPAHVPLRAEDMAFWYGVIGDMAYPERTPQRLLLAAQLARTMADLAAEQERSDAEPTVITGPRGTLMVNPRLKVIDALIGRMVTGIRQLRLHHQPRAAAPPAGL